MFCPKYIFALQESSEIEHLLTYVEKRHTVSILRLPISEHAQKRTPELRRRAREEKYREYFDQSQMVKISLSQIALKGYIWDGERDLNADGMKNLLLALCDSENYALALGILQKFDLQNQCLHILAPITPKDCEKVRTVQLGEIKINPDGQEESS